MPVDNSIDHARDMLASVFTVLDTKWPYPRTEFEIDLLRQLLEIGRILDIHISKDVRRLEE